MITILQGDALEQLRTLSNGSVHCCVTSPPYYGLRNYGVEMQIEPVEYCCCVCGCRLPTNIPKDRMVAINCAIKRGGEQYLYFCKDRHTEDEVMAAITGVPRFKKASQLDTSPNLKHSTQNRYY